MRLEKQLNREKEHIQQRNHKAYQTQRGIDPHTSPIKEFQAHREGGPWLMNGFFFIPSMNAWHFARIFTQAPSKSALAERACGATLEADTAFARHPRKEATVVFKSSEDDAAEELTTNFPENGAEMFSTTFSEIGALGGKSRSRAVGLSRIQKAVFKSILAFPKS